jgi:signal transduction histidine kinase/ActR/RegA family two-component response regulator
MSTLNGSVLPDSQNDPNESVAAATALAMDVIYARGDRWIRYFVLGHLALALILAAATGQWLVSTLAAFASAALFLCAERWWPRSQATRYAAGISLQAFCALAIYQLDGLPEMHFFFFSAVTMMIVYQDWKAMWPGVILIVLQHILFAALQNGGHGIHYFGESHVGVVKLGFHFGIALAQCAIASFWAYRLQIQTAHDVAQRAELEYHRSREQLAQQAQKMEAVGQLAGGIAHDFNNLLTVISGHCEMMQHEVPPDSTLADDLSQVRRAAERAAALTRQLLAFGRRQLLQPKRLDVNRVIADVEPMLRRVIGADITIEVDLSTNASVVVADAGQLEQVIVNLAVNARDAMPRGGTLSVTTSNAKIDTPHTLGDSTVPPGEYVTLAVRDTGVGMDLATRSRVFEPFFTTKELGKGTGLGLATVYGIVKQSRGYVTLETEPGAGSTFTLFLPRVAGAVAGDEVKATSPRMAGARLNGKEQTVLLVDDEPTLRLLSQRSLEQAGYRVLSAVNGADALERVAAHEGTIDIVVTDLVMPAMGGRELVEQLIARGMSFPVLFMSGYTDDEVMRRGLLEPGCAFLPKPFGLDAFIGKVREVLDRPRPTSAAVATDGRAA